jgi:crotonobetainyl-CoA:carnitine CoA-transferase CaiB-like acyl-CoA transferase
MIAHFARLQTGRGQHVEISVQQSVTQATLGSHLAPAVGHPDYTLMPKPKQAPAARPKPLDLSGSGSRTRRSKWVVRDGLVELHLGMGFAAGDKTNNLFAWMAAEGALPQPMHGWDWRALPQDINAGKITEEDVEEARDHVARFLAPRTKLDLFHEAHARKILLAPVNDIADLLASAQLQARGFFATVDEGGAARTIPGAFAMGPDGMFAAPRAAPARGEHNAAVYGELLGLDAPERARLSREGVI